jgi:hypothetical protein
VWAPALYTYLAINWGTPGWLLIGLIVVLAAVGIHPATRAAERFLMRAEIAGEAGIQSPLDELDGALSE